MMVSTILLMLFLNTFLNIFEAAFSMLETMAGLQGALRYPAYAKEVYTPSVEK